MAETAPRVMNGTFTRVWVDGVLVAGLSGFSAKISKQKQEVNMCGQMAVDSKTTNVKGTGNLDFHEIYTLFTDDLEKIMQGIDVRHTIVGELNDPDAYGAKRIAFYNCSYDDHTFFDSTSGQPGKNSKPFTFTNAEYLDKVLPA